MSSRWENLTFVLSLYFGLVCNVLKTFIKNITPSLPNIRHLRLSIPFPPFWECRRDQRWIRRELKEFGQQIGVKIEIWNLQDISLEIPCESYSIGRTL